MSAPLSRLARQVIPRLELLVHLEEITVPDAAELLKTTPKWVRANLPIIHHSPHTRGQRVRLVDIEKYQAKRTVWPRENGAT